MAPRFTNRQGRITLPPAAVQQAREDGTGCLKSGYRRGVCFRIGGAMTGYLDFEAGCVRDVVQHVGMLVCMGGASDGS